MTATRVLVTGATGFTGSHLVRALFEEGQDVRVIARNAARAKDRLPPGVDIVHGDVTEREVIARAVRGRDVIYHLAASFREAGIPDSRYHAVHVGATRLLLERARAESIGRFVHVSTVGVHGHIARPPADENCPYGGGDIYQVTKGEGERVALEFQRTHAFPLTVIRPVAIYGPGDTRFLKLFRAVARRRFVMIGNGETLLHMVHVRDLVCGMRLAAASNAAVGEAFIIGGDEFCSLNELVGLIAAVSNVPRPRLHVPVWPFFLAGALCEAVCVPLRIEPPIYRRRVAFFTKSRAFTIEKARRLLGYRASVELRFGLAETAAWYRAHGWV